MLKPKEGLIVVISAPSGAGKTTICKRLLQTSFSFTYSVSFTTRPPRKNEIEGVDYYFVSREEFERLIKEGGFVEWAEVHGELYGTSKKLLEETIKAKKNVLLEVDVRGGTKIKENYPEAVLIFLLPPSWEELERRLKGRGTEEEKKIQKRIERAKEEVKYASRYDYLVINDDVNRAVEDILSIVKAEALRVKRFSKEEVENFLSPG